MASCGYTCYQQSSYFIVTASDWFYLKDCKIPPEQDPLQADLLTFSCLGDNTLGLGNFSSSYQIIEQKVLQIVFLNEPLGHTPRKITKIRENEKHFVQYRWALPIETQLRNRHMGTCSPLVLKEWELVLSLHKFYHSYYKHPIGTMEAGIVQVLLDNNKKNSL